MVEYHKGLLEYKNKESKYSSNDIYQVGPVPDIQYFINMLMHASRSDRKKVVKQVNESLIEHENPDSSLSTKSWYQKNLKRSGLTAPNEWATLHHTDVIFWADGLSQKETNDLLGSLYNRATSIAIREHKKRVADMRVIADHKNRRAMAVWYEEDKW